MITHPSSGLTPPEAADWIASLNASAEPDCPALFASLAAHRKGEGALVTFDAGEFLGSLRTWDSFVTYVLARLGPAIGLSPADFSVLEDSLPATGASVIASSGVSDRVEGSPNEPASTGGRPGLALAEPRSR